MTSCLDRIQAGLGGVVKSRPLFSRDQTGNAAVVQLLCFCDMLITALMILRPVSSS